MKSLPFGINHTKPRHYSLMARVLWQNRRDLGYAWRVLTRGVCDGCALGTTGVRDWTLDGTHLCMVRLELLKLNTMAAFNPNVLRDIATLQTKTEAELRELGRLPYPMLRERDAPGFRRITWEDALARIGRRIAASDPDRLSFFLTSRGLTNEVYYVAQKVARYLGTPHIENSARLCHSPSTAGMKATVGVGASTVSYTDWIGTDLLVFFGTNFPNDQPVATKYVELARNAGTQVFGVNSYKEPGLERYWIPSSPKSAVFGTPMVDRFFQVHQGGDLAFLCLVMRGVLAAGAEDRVFLDAHTEGFAALKESLETLDDEALLRLSGSTREDVDAFTQAVCKARSAVFVWSMGITQHAHGADTVKAICDLALLRGFIGREKCGLVPIRGHSGVQGGAEMGAYATVLPGRPMTPEGAAELSAIYGFEVPGRKGYATPEMLDAAHRGEVDVLYSVGGNFLGTMPQPGRAEEALSRVPLRVHQDILLNPSMLVPAQEEVILLPSRTRYEQVGGGTETTTERRVVFSPYIPGRRVGEARSDWEILQDVATAAKPEQAERVRFGSGEEIREEIARVIPAYRGIETLKRAGDAFQRGGPRLCEGGEFPLPGGKARLVVVRPPEVDMPAGWFRMGTRRGKQFNSMVQAERDPLNGAKRRDVLLAQEDAEALGVGDGAAIVLHNEHGRFEARVKLAPIRPGNVQGHWPEINVLVPEGRRDPEALVPDYTAWVQIEPAS